MLFRALADIDDQGIGRSHHDIGIRVLLLNLPTGVSDAGSGVARFGLRKNVINRNIGNLLLDNADVFLVCHNPHALNRTDWFQSIYRLLNEGTTDPHHVDELLGVVGC